jgi:hypothetical protein
LALDYILVCPDDNYFDTAEAKRRYFVETLKVPESIFTRGTDQADAITFGDRFPISVSRTATESAPAVAFTYVASKQVGLDPFIKHLRTYRPLFACFSHFQFVYISTALQALKEAAELFALLIQGKGLADLLRYYSLEAKWDNKQYGELATEELIFLSQSRKRYTGESFATLYYLWKRNATLQSL